MVEGFEVRGQSTVNGPLRGTNEGGTGALGVALAQ